MQSKVNSSPFRSGRNILFSSHIGVWWVLYALCTLYVCLWRLSQHDRLFRLLFASQVHTHKIHNARRRTHNKSKQQHQKNWGKTIRINSLSFRAYSKFIYLFIYIFGFVNKSAFTHIVYTLHIYWHADDAAAAAVAVHIICISQFCCVALCCLFIALNCLLLPSLFLCYSTHFAAAY